MSGDAGALSECEKKTVVTLDHTAFQVRNSWYGQVESCQSSSEDLDMGRHKKAPVRCPCSQLAVHHDAAKTPGYINKKLRLLRTTTLRYSTFPSLNNFIFLKNSILRYSLHTLIIKITLCIALATAIKLSAT